MILIVMWRAHKMLLPGEVEVNAQSDAAAVSLQRFDETGITWGSDPPHRCR